jgi:hypothetical protein
MCRFDPDFSKDRAKRAKQLYQVEICQSSPQHPLHPCGMKPTLLGPAVNLSASWFVYAMRLEVCS